MRQVRRARLPYHQIVSREAEHRAHWLSSRSAAAADAVPFSPLSGSIRPAKPDSELSALIKSSPASSAALPRSVFSYDGARTALGFEQFVSTESLWTAVKADEYPWTVEPVAMQWSDSDDRQQQSIDRHDAAGPQPSAHIEKVKPSPAAALQAVRLAEAAVEVAAAGGFAGMSGLASLSSALLSLLLGIALLLVAGVCYFLYSSARDRAGSSKLV